MEKKNAVTCKLAIIIPTHNRKKELQNLLDQIANQKVKSIYSIATIVVVDGSTDGTLEMLEMNYPNVQFVHGDGNWWYTKSMNEGFKYALIHINPDLFLTMNDDTEVDENYINSILNAYTRVENDSIVGSVSFTKSEPTRILNSGNFYKNHILGLLKSYIPTFKHVDPKEVKDKVLPSVTLPGRGMLIPVKTLKDLDLFDESLKQYHSDSDFCLRARKKGFKVYITWDAYVYVHEKLTDSGSSFLKNDFKSFILNFFRPTSRFYIPAKAKMLWRHKLTVLWPINFMIFMSTSFYNYFFKKKLN